MEISQDSNNLRAFRNMQTPTPMENAQDNPLQDVGVRSKTLVEDSLIFEHHVFSI